MVALVLASVLMANAGPSAFAAQPNASGFRALSGSAAANFTLPGDLQLVRRFALPAYGLTYERYQQFVGSAEVFGAQITLYRGGSGTVTTVIGSHYPNIVPTNAVGLARANAEAIAARDIGAAGTRLVSLMIDPASGRYFYRVETHRPDSRWIHWIDAGSGTVLKKYNALAYDCGARPQPCGFGVAYDDGDSNDIKDLSGLTTPSSSGFQLRSADKRQETHDQGSSRRPFLGPIATDADDSWVQPGNTSPAQPALVDAQYYARVTDDYFLQKHSYNWVAAGQSSQVSAMVIHAHYSANYNNAFWNGRYVAVGDGDGVTFREFTALDVLGHELTHGVTDFTSNLVYQDESGALNEAFSDMMGNSIEAFARDTNREPATTLTPDWFVGEDIYLPEKGTAAPGFRNMADPEEDGDPDHYSERQIGGDDNGGVHTNSGIPNHAYYLLVNGGLNASCATPSTHNSAHCTDTVDTQDNNLSVAGIGLADAERIFFLGFTALNQNATMCDARAATEAVAGTTFLQSTTDAWVAVGLTDMVCGGGGTPPPSGTTMHVGDLDGTSSSVGRNKWRATVTITVHDATHSAVSGATVNGTWSGGTSGSDSCTTDSSGLCSLTSSNINNSQPGVTFAVTGVTHASLSYDSSANHDPDSDSSNGTTITVSRP